MFAIVNGELYISHANNQESHLMWFAREGWITRKTDSVFEHIPRGMVDIAGDVYFYQGKNYSCVDEMLIRKVLVKIVRMLSVPKTGRVYNGVLKQEPGTRWPGKQKLGQVSDILN